MKFVLLLLSFVFRFIVAIKNILFDLRLLPVRGVNTKVISVGNISMGGTGKTPVVAHLISALHNKKVSVISRGYGGHYSESATYVDPNRERAAYHYGDEPVWFARNFQIPVYVGRRRIHAARMAVRESQPEVIIADDAFQHRWLKRDLDIVLIDVTESKNQLLPAGRLREPFSSLRRANYVFLTKTNLIPHEHIQSWENVLKPFGFSQQQGNLFLVEYALRPIVPIQGGTPLAESQKVILASGIAQPESFAALVHGHCHVQEHFILPDHHAWKQSDIESLAAIARRIGTSYVVTTEKDAVKLKGLSLAPMQFFVAELKTQIQPDFSSKLGALLHNI